jgi:hypothetical protein
LLLTGSIYRIDGCEAPGYPVEVYALYGIGLAFTHELIRAIVIPEFSTQVLEIVNQLMHDHAAYHRIIPVLQAIIQVDDTVVVVPSGNVTVVVTAASMLHKEGVRPDAVFGSRIGIGIVGQVTGPAQQYKQKLGFTHRFDTLGYPGF